MSPTTAVERKDRVDWLRSIPFFLVHLVALGALFTGVGWWEIGLCVGLYYLRMFGVTAGFHRYFSHRTFKTTRLFQFVLAVLGTMSAQKGVLWWAAHHRVHHRHADREGDVHSPTLRGFWWAHCGWVLCRRYETTLIDRVKDLARFPELRWLNRNHLLPPIVLATLLFWIGGWSWLLWGFFVSTVLLWHGTFTINSLAHVFGRVRYPTTDTSRNSYLLSLITLGEGWHNNHHYYPGTVRQGFFWWELDPTYYALRLLSCCRLVWDLRPVPAELVAEAA
jgi:stearoyl-CoA desaturase (delta-9 desaturase)